MYITKPHIMMSYILRRKFSRAWPPFLMSMLLTPSIPGAFNFSPRHAFLISALVIAN